MTNFLHWFGKPKSAKPALVFKLPGQLAPGEYSIVASTNSRGLVYTAFKCDSIGKLSSVEVSGSQVTRGGIVVTWYGGPNDLEWTDDELRMVVRRVMMLSDDNPTTVEVSERHPKRIVYMLP